MAPAVGTRVTDHAHEGGHRHRCHQPRDQRHHRARTTIVGTAALGARAADIRVVLHEDPDDSDEQGEAVHGPPRLLLGLGADAFTGAQNLGAAPVREDADEAYWGPARVK